MTTFAQIIFIFMQDKGPTNHRVRTNQFQERVFNVHFALAIFINLSI
jgi:hypothetical protein